MVDATYQVRVAGVIPDELLAELQGVTVNVEPPETVLQGAMPDQAAVVGLITQVHGLGLRLIEVRRLTVEDDFAG